MIKRIICIFVLLTVLLSLPVFAADMYCGYVVPVDIEINGSFIKCAEKPILSDSTTYIPLRAFTDAVGGAVKWDENERAATINKNNQEFVFYSDKNYCIVNGVEHNYKSIIYKNLMFIPVRAVSELLGYTVEWDDFYLSVKITAPDVELADEFKDNSYTYEDVLYLSKIAQLECGYERFEVKLGVAGTVVNRMKSSQFPNTIKGVVLDTKYGVQFPPAHTESINVTPSKDTVIAAKCALNGADVVGDSLYFVDVKHAPSSWVHKNRTLYTTIYSMSFYK